MRFSSLVSVLLPLACVSARPYIDKRQDGNISSSATSPNSSVSSSGTITPAVESASSISSASTGESSPANGSSSTRSRISVMPSPSTPGPEDCPPCGDLPYYPTITPSGKVCYCLGDGTPGRNNGDNDPWTRAAPVCTISGNDPAPDGDGPGSACSVLGVTPESRECLNACNLVVSAVNLEVTTCSKTVIEAARTCSNCTNPNVHFQVPGVKEWQYLEGEDSVKKLEDGLASYCSRPQRCYDIRAGTKISGQGGCPVLAADANVSPSENYIYWADRSFTDIAGTPTYAEELLTIDGQVLVPSTAFTGTRPTDVYAIGGVSGTEVASFSTISVLVLATGWLLG